ncbi:MAG: F0F1 ATP synthase subunit B [Gammaproteobacteria bacterium]|nr:F0F1 ATP synthase subunit B [Gammaproteobacteria bacterium]
MNVTLTLVGQMLTFLVLVWFVMKFLWVPMLKVLEDRQKKIADGLAAAEEGLHAQERAEAEVAEQLKKVREQAGEVLAQAQRRRDEIVEEAKAEARVEGERLLTAARAEIDHERNQAREGLRKEVVDIAIAGAEQLLGREVDKSAHNDLLDRLAQQLN